MSQLDTKEENPRVSAARESERRLYEHYGFETTDHRVEVPELDSYVRVAEVGTGPPLVLMPGGVGHGDILVPLLPELRGYTAFVVDRPGGGLSSPIDHRSLPLRVIAAASTAAVFDHFDIDEAPMVANSMGGHWALRFALDQPERVSAMALLGCPALYPETSAPFPMRLLSVPGLGGLLHGLVMQPGDADGARESAAFLGHPEEKTEEFPEPLMESWYRMENLPDAKRSWVSLLQQAARLRGAQPDAAFTPDDLRSVQPPVLLLWGSDDPFGSVELGRRGARYFPDATFYEVGIGHLPWLDEPEECGALIRHFLGEHA